MNMHVLPKASMGPRSDNRGYGQSCTLTKDSGNLLQWVHGPITVVMERNGGSVADDDAGFNGSTVR